MSWLSEVRKYLTLGGWLLALGLGWGFVRSAQHSAVLDEQLQVAGHMSDSLTIYARQQSDSADVSRKVANAMRVAARAEVKRDSLQRIKTDSTIRESANERQRAERLLADSLATTADLRDALGRMAVRGRSDSVAYTVQSAADQHTIHTLSTALASDSTALQRGVSALQAATKRAESAEAMNKLYQQARPSTFGNLARSVGWAGVGFAVAKLAR